MAASYNTRRWKVNYKFLGNPWPQIPRVRRQKVEDKLYPVEVTERTLNRVKIHYIGYGSEDDEWRDADDSHCKPDSTQIPEKAVQKYV